MFYIFYLILKKNYYFQYLNHFLNSKFLQKFIISNKLNIYYFELAMTYFMVIYSLLNQLISGLQQDITIVQIFPFRAICSFMRITYKSCNFKFNFKFWCKFNFQEIKKLLQFSRLTFNVVSTTFYTRQMNSSSMKYINYIHENNKEFFCGCGAATCNLVITYPIHKVMFRQQLLAISTLTAIKQLRAEGPFLLYRGFLPPVIQKASSLSIMFGMYEKCNKWTYQMYPNIPINIVHTSSALIAGSLEASLVPFERVQTLMQNKNYHNKFTNTFHAFKELRHYGLKEYFRGVTPVLLRNGPSNVIFFTYREKIKEHLPHSDKILINTLEDFISGGILGALISTTCFPINSIKTHMQSTLGGRFPGFIESFTTVYTQRNRKFRNLFIGVHVNYTRSLISWGIINSSYELLKKYL